MKAWVVSNKHDDDLGQEIIWANTLTEAKKLMTSTGIGNWTDNYSDLRIIRHSTFDDLEKLSNKEFMKVQWIHGWRWFDTTKLPYYDEIESSIVDEVWDAWYKKNYGDEE